MLRRLRLVLLIAAATTTWGVGRALAVDTAEASEAAATSEAERSVESVETTEATEVIEAADPIGADTSGDGMDALSAKERKGIEEMYVTGKRGRQDTQSMAESISSFTGAEIEDRGIINFDNLQYSVPNLFSGGGLVKITLRGVGSEIVGPGTDPGFAVHVNSVFSARESTGLISYFDIDRVDVLRGPQGTLWGRNSTGGAINVITKRPIYEYDASAEIEYGRFEGDVDGLRTLGMLNIPLLDERLAFRAAFLTQHDDGMMSIHGPDNDQRTSDMGLATVRATLRWEPREDVTVDLIGSYLRNKRQGGGQKFDGEYFTPPNVPDTVIPGLYPGISVPSWPGAGPGLNYENDEVFGAALPNPQGAYEGTANEPQHQRSELYTATLLASWQADQFRLDSITGFQLTEFFLHRDQDTSSLPISTLDLTDESRQISQELLLNSTWDRSYDYTFGTIYQYDWTPVTELYVPDRQSTWESRNWVLLPYSTLGGETINLVDGCNPSTNAGCPPTKPLGVVREDFVDALTEVENHVFGLYGNLSWEIVDALTLGVGGRFSYTHRDWDGQTLAQNYITASVLGPTGLQILQKGRHQTKDWMSGTWHVTADYQIMDEHLLWASVGTGSRAGGFQFSEEDSFDSEEILAVEAGAKNMFFDNRLMLNVTGFWYDWDDPQISGTENALPITTNAPSAISYGIEFDWLAQPTEGLVLNGSFGWLEAYYDEPHFERDSTQQKYRKPDLRERAKRVNLKGNRVPRSPRFTASFGAQYTLDLGRFGTLTPRVDFYFRDRLTFRQYGNPDDEEHAYTRTDARITWRSVSEKLWAELYVRDLENNAIRTNQEILASIYRVHYHDQPISGGFRVGYSLQ